MDTVSVAIHEEVFPRDRTSGFSSETANAGTFPVRSGSHFSAPTFRPRAYYGFPLNQGIVKIANHGAGSRNVARSPATRRHARMKKTDLREFLRSTIPSLADAPIVYTRICMYCDTNDGDFWIAPDPERSGLIVATGDCGHGFKFAPVLGEIIADAVEGKSNPFLKKFRWRPEVHAGVTKEAARFRRLK